MWNIYNWMGLWIVQNCLINDQYNGTRVVTLQFSIQNKAYIENIGIETFVSNVWHWKKFDWQSAD